ncbi:GNAT family N-acetyltransferase [Micromonospora echinofusca]|uniref:GNAT family N-acetyltransferase n=1 Tax=Micromonospora echinofusca TaxID=47858 RepID=A0ABS3VQD1_MICEH|nr:GNAT family N-acetyltransferase [Micromonospora echinofusca]MBO4206683.1 GNAT family N-acetyltransferase [Micromonospora echinofusca]
MEPEITLSELTDDQVPAVTALCAEALDLADDAAEAGAILATLRVRAAADRPVVGFVAWRGGPGGRHGGDGGTPVGVVIGSMSQREPGRGHVDLLAVAPDSRRKGIGRSLLARVEEALAGLGATEVVLAGNPPHYAWPGIDVRYTPAVCAALALGYHQHNTAWNMTADLSYPGSPALRSTAAAESRLAGQGVVVRRAEPTDLPALTRFARETFGGSWDGELANSVGRPDAGCHLALRDGEIIGFAAYGSSRPSWFGPMGTAPSAEGSGIGGVLLRRCLADQRAGGHDRAQIGWVGPVPFYSGSAGARIERVFFLYRKAL